MKAASVHRIRFVPTCGGHSLWFTVGAEGFILDFSKFKSIQVGAAEHKVTVAGGVLMTELSTALTAEGECVRMGLPRVI